MVDICDNRSAAQKHTHTVLVMGTDTFLSGWGRALNGASIAAWACTPDDVPAVRAWVESRSDIRDVTVEWDENLPDDCVQLSIYVVDDNHPAMRGAE